MPYKLSIFSGNEMSPFRKLISKLRTNSFAKYPYLYVANDAYENDYVDQFFLANKSSLGVAFSQGIPIGIVTAMPLSSSAEIISEASNFFSAGKLPGNIDEHYYYGEIIVDSQHQKHGLGKALVEQHDNFAKKNGYKHVSFLSLKQKSGHPLKPHMHVEQAEIWHRMGFWNTSICFRYAWPTKQTDGSAKDQTHELEFWTKTLSM